jgi:hypothetical protein
MDLDRLKTDVLFKSVEQLKGLAAQNDSIFGLISSAEELLHRQGETGTDHSHAVSILIAEVLKSIGSRDFLKLTCG